MKGKEKDNISEKLFEKVKKEQKLEENRENYLRKPDFSGESFASRDSFDQSENRSLSVTVQVRKTNERKRVKKDKECEKLSSDVKQTNIFSESQNVIKNTEEKAKIKEITLEDVKEELTNTFQKTQYCDKNKMLNLKFANTNNVLKTTAESEKILFIERTCDDKKFPGISPFLLKKVIDNAAGGPVITAKLTREGKIFVHTKDRKQASKIMTISHMISYNVIVKEDEKRNKSVGVIFCPDLKYSSDDEILKELGSQHVSGLKRMTKKNTEGNIYETGLYFLTFDMQAIPKEMKIGYQIIDVREYIPNPTQCFKCLKFGHTQKFCNSKEEKKCGNCSKVIHTIFEDGQKCQRKTRCNNCGSSEHGSFAKTCPVYVMEKEITAIKVKSKVTYRKAREEYCLKNPLHERSFASTVTSQGRPPDIRPGASSNSTLATRDTTKKTQERDTLMEIQITDSEDVQNKRGPPSPLENEKNNKKKK